MKLHTLTFLALLLPAMTTRAQETGKAEDDVPVFNLGARIGFAATGTYITDAFIDGHKLTEYTQDTQIGNFIAFLFRFNSKKMLVQSGIGLSYNKSSFTMDKTSWDSESESRDELTCSYSMISATIPLQLGFHIVNRPPYCMSAFTGPRLRYTPDKYYTVEYGNMPPYQFTESPARLVIGWTAGFSVQIGRTFMDFEYEASLNNITGPMYDTSGATPAPDYRLDRRVGIISFSYGIMF